MIRFILAICLVVIVVAVILLSSLPKRVSGPDAFLFLSLRDVFEELDQNLYERDEEVIKLKNKLRRRACSYRKLGERVKQDLQEIYSYFEEDE